MLLLGLGFLFSTCEDDKNTSLLLIGCCNNDPLTASFGNAFLFLPNIFTPNNDGVNDRFIPYGYNIEEIIDFEIKNNLGITVFHQSHFQQGAYSFAWDGYVNGKVRKGLYSYNLMAKALDGTIGKFSGKVCNFPCDVPSNEVIAKENCVNEGILFCWQGIWDDCWQAKYDCYYH